MSEILVIAGLVWLAILFPWLWIVYLILFIAGGRR
jgi:hypothetical protein